jgi:transporter family protein
MTAVLAKIGVADINPDLATLIRTVVILVLLTVIAGATGAWEQPRNLSSRAVIFLVLSGFATGASWLCYFRALKMGDAARVAPIDKLSVVLVAVLGVAFLGEKLNYTNWLGVMMIAAGAILVGIRF